MTLPLRIGDVSLGDVPRIAVPLCDDDPAGDVAAVRHLADLIELRVDCFAALDAAHVCDVIRQVRRSGTLPIIGTVRWAQEGGRAPLADDERAGLYAAILPLVDAVDVELRSPLRDRVVREAQAQGRLSIVSYHDFGAVPPFYELEGLVDEADAAAASILKVAAAAASLADVRRLLEFTLRHRERGLVTIALGAVGAVSRLVFPLAGSLFTFAHHRTPSAPGQLPLAEMRAELSKYFPGR
jgi:3-dehydroquinate dehydratase-1